MMTGVDFGLDEQTKSRATRAPPSHPPPHLPFPPINEIFAAQPPGLPIGTSLSTLLATESLLFAALNVGLLFGQRTARGTSRWLSARALAISAALTIAAAAVGAAAAWWRIFGVPWQNDGSTAVQGFCLLVGIVAEPILAFAIALNVPRPPTAEG